MVSLVGGFDVARSNVVDALTSITNADVQLTPEVKGAIDNWCDTVAQIAQQKGGKHDFSYDLRSTIEKGCVSVYNVLDRQISSGGSIFENDLERLKDLERTVILMGIARMNSREDGPLEDNNKKYWEKQLKSFENPKSQASIEGLGIPGHKNLVRSRNMNGQKIFPRMYRELGIIISDDTPTVGLHTAPTNEKA